MHYIIFLTTRYIVCEQRPLAKVHPDMKEIIKKELFIQFFLYLFFFKKKFMKKK